MLFSGSDTTPKQFFCLSFEENCSEEDYFYFQG